MDHVGVCLLGERSARRCLPDMLFIIVVLAPFTNLVRNQIHPHRTQTPICPIKEMSPPALVALTKALVPDLAIVPTLFTSSSSVRILNRDGRIAPVRNGLDEIGLSLWIGDGLVPDPVEGIGGIRNQLVEKDFLVGKEAVHDHAHQLLNVGIGRGGTWFRETLEQ